MSRFPELAATFSLALTLTAAPVLAGNYGLGRPATDDEIAAWNVDVEPDGTGLPDGEGSVEDGEALFSDYCAICHGDFAEGVDNWPKLAGGEGTLDREDPLKTVGSYWPYLTTTWDYVHRSMPFGNAQTLSPDEVYAVVAYILYSNDLVDEDFVLSRDNLLDVTLPNHDGFILDDRAETEYSQWTREPCMENCKDTVEITVRAAVLDVTPEETRARKVREMVKSTNPRNPQSGEAAARPQEQVAEAQPAGETPAEVTETAAAPDPELVAAGEKAFKKCAACHQVGEGAKNKVGPQLNGIVGAPAGAHVDFKYSKAMQDAAAGGLVWTEADLAEFLKKPRDFLKGTKMSFAGFKKDDEVAAVIAYLKTFPQH